MIGQRVDTLEDGAREQCLPFDRSFLVGFRWTIRVAWHRPRWLVFGIGSGKTVNSTWKFVNPYWQIMENSSRNFSKIFIFWVVTQAVLLENSSIKNHRFYWNHIWYVTFGLDEFSSKTFCVTPQNWNFEKKLDEFSSKTACVTTQKMKILGKFLDEFSMICQ